MRISILKLSRDEALDFLMKSEQYVGFELPEYFKFDKLLGYIRKTIGEEEYDNCISTSPKDIQEINIEILLNKDGRYAVRPLTITNPYLYYFVARELCCESGWSAIIDCFDKFKVKSITSSALPVISYSKEQFHRSATILNWWTAVEQKSIELSLDYRYMFMTDITNCYGSINPQSIDWAIARKGTQYETQEYSKLSNNLIRYLGDMQQGRNIGIPQGSAIFDLLAEIILGYSDLLLHEALEKEGISSSEYHIIRYRDDYRIFCNSKSRLEEISYILQGVLEQLNFRMNSQKTCISDSIVTDSIKNDKLSYISSAPIHNGNWRSFASTQKELLYILMFSRKFPNGGQIKNLLSSLSKAAKIKIDNRPSNKILFTLGKIKFEEVNKESKDDIPDIKSQIAIVTQIAIENITSAHYALRLASILIESIDDKAKRIEIIKKIYHKLHELPNSSYTEIWLQNMSYQYDIIKKCCEYDHPLCKYVINEQEDLWDNSWLKPKYTKGFSKVSICDSHTLPVETSEITFREIRGYGGNYDTIEAVE